MTRIRTKQDYFSGRMTELLYNRHLGLAEKELADTYKKILRETEVDMKDLYDFIQLNKNGGTVLVSDLYRYNNYYKLINNLNAALTHLGNRELHIIEQKLGDLYRQNSSLVSSAIGFGGQFSEQALKNCIDGVWCADGLNWSDRIWRDKTALNQKLVDGLTEFIVTGKGKQELTNQLVRDFEVSFNSADRIVRTELAYTQNKSAMDTFEQAGIEYYKVLPAHDKKVCGICKELAKEIYPISDTEHMPPAASHCNCRCAIIAVLPNEAHNAV